MNGMVICTGAQNCTHDECPHYKAHYPNRCDTRFPADEKEHLSSGIKKALIDECKNTKCVPLGSDLY